jgi:hypothetical protein
MDFPEPQARPAIVERYARLLASFGREIGKRPLVLPNADFFPDRFTGDGPSASALVERMMGHAGLSDVPLRTRVVEDQEPESPHGGSCSSGCQVPAALAASVPRLSDDGAQWTLNIPKYELAHSVVLTTMVARALGHVFLVEILPSGARIEAPVDVTADHAAVALGFGSLLLEGAYIYSKGCGGPQVASVTGAALGELALVAALFVEVGGHSIRKALSAAGTTQRAVLSEAHSWVKSNPALVKALRNDPVRVAAGNFRLEDEKPWLFRIFKRESAADEPPRDLVAAKAPPPTPKPADPKRDELRSLVDEALRDARADAE